MTARVTRSGVITYLNGKLAELERHPGDLRQCDIQDVRLFCDGAVSKFDDPSFDRSGLERYVNEELDWHIDMVRLTGRQRSVRREEKRHFVAIQNICYDLIQHYGLRRVRDSLD